MTSIPDQKFRWASEPTGSFKAAMEALLSVANCPKVPVRYTVAGAHSPLAGFFECTGMVPVAAIERCKQDQSFNHAFLHCLAHSYREEML